MDPFIAQLARLCPTRSASPKCVCVPATTVGRTLGDQLTHPIDCVDCYSSSSQPKVYARFPGWFKLPRPLGSYNPDWAVLVQTEESERLYFVVETKGSLFADDLREREKAKNDYGKAHFKAVRVGESPAEYVVAKSPDDVFNLTKVS